MPSNVKKSSGSSKTGASTGKSGTSSGMNQMGAGSRKDVGGTAGKSMKESFVRYLSQCSKVYDYKDETKDL